MLGRTVVQLAGEGVSTTVTAVRMSAWGWGGAHGCADFVVGELSATDVQGSLS